MKIYNNLSRKLENLEPLNPPVLSIYSCGPTVYDHSHIGHARSAITWDLLYRYLKYLGYKVRWARNITNVDDKIVKRASEQGIAPDKLSREFTYEFWRDMNALNVSWPDYEPRATDYIPAMTKYIEELIASGFAYAIDGDVYFRVSKHTSYGQLKGLSLEKLADGLARVEENERKENKLDFALWKSFPNEDEAFDSPWGRGRPGWHLECSTMIEEIFGSKPHGDSLIDIHAGGDDLLFPHHENECAQSECHTGKKLAKYWMHNGMVMINGAKMSKSENNFLTIKDVLKKYKANTVRYFCLSTHYKKQINFTHEALKAAETGFDKLIGTIHKELGGKAFLLGDPTKSKSINRKLWSDFDAAMDNDLNSAQALALLFDASKDPENLLTIAYLLDLLGFNLKATDALDANTHEALQATMGLILELRAEARAKKDFATSDKIRDQLSAAGITINDHRDKASDWVIEH